MFFEKFKLIADAFFEVISKIDIEMTDRIGFNFCVFSQFLFGLYSRTFGGDTVMIAYLQQDRTRHVLGMFDRSVFVTSYGDAGTGFVDKIL